MKDTIYREDAIKAVRKIVPVETEMEATLLDKAEVIVELSALPSAELVLQTPQTYGKSINPSNAEVVSDYISRQDAIRWVKTECNPYGKPTLDFESGKNVIEHLGQMPSADRPTVIRSRTLMPTKDFKEWAKRIKEVNPNAVVIPCDAEVASAEAVQGWIPVEEQPPVFPCLVCDANGNQPSVPLGIVTITDEEHGEWHIDGRLWDTKIFFKGEWCSQTGYGNRIIAWMPLPTPYKGGDVE